MTEILVPPSFSELPYATQRFENIAKWAKGNHPFYQEWLQGGEVPILTRSDVLDNNQKILNGHPVTDTTSGSTGVPVQISWSKERRLLEQEVTSKFVGWLGGTLPCTKIVRLTREKHGDEFIDVTQPVAKQLEKIQERYQRVGAIAITTYPTNAERLCQAVLDSGLDMSHIQRFGCYAEVFEEYQEELINQAFPNANIWTTYSSREFGMIAARCPHEPDYHHIFAGKLGVEILDDEGRPCADGELGRILITDYFNKNAPFIRYEIGDLAARGHCPCGKINLPALSAVVGKVRGALVHRSGERVPFSHFSVALRDIEGVRQYQVVQHELERFEFRYVTNLSGQPREQLFAAVKSEFQSHFGYLPDIQFTLEEEIKRGENGKHYASISYV